MTRFVTKATALAEAVAVGEEEDPGVRALLELLDERDRGLRRHSEAVAQISVAVAGELGLTERQRETLRRAALLHDVGKLAIPDAVLRKPGPLDVRERVMIESHPVWSHRITLAMGWVHESCWVLHHHERPDGRGYPHGLRRGQIAIESRILHVADAFDALTTDRPYRPAQTRTQALRILLSGAGTEFDPDCVAVLVGTTSSRARRYALPPV